jgi:dihydroxy-acid dehydratase
MPEWGMLPIPKRLLGQGVRDMIRISDGRMSGTSYGACILHVAPESYVGGPLALVETGDEIEIDVDKRLIHLHVTDEELARRKAAWQKPAPRYLRGYGAIYSDHIGQADQGCDFDFLQGTAKIPEPEIH